MLTKVETNKTLRAITIALRPRPAVVCKRIPQSLLFSNCSQTHCCRLPMRARNRARGIDSHVTSFTRVSTLRGRSLTLGARGGLVAARLGCRKASKENLPTKSMRRVPETLHLAQKWGSSGTRWTCCSMPSPVESAAGRAAPGLAVDDEAPSSRKAAKKATKALRRAKRAGVADESTGQKKCDLCGNTPLGKMPHRHDEKVADGLRPVLEGRVRRRPRRRRQSSKLPVRRALEECLSPSGATRPAVARDAARDPRSYQGGLAKGTPRPTRRARRACVC